MGSGPKKQDYEPSEMEKASASVAKAEHDKFRELYAPLLRNMRDQSLSTDPTKQLRRRANADTMQALTTELDFRKTQDLESTSDTAGALIGQLNLAGTKGKQIENQAKTNVLGVARKQVGDAQSGMASASRLETGNLLNRAAARQQVRMARNEAAGQIAGSLLAQGISNMQTQGESPASQAADFVGPPQMETKRGSFFRPVNSQGQQALGFINRLNYSGTLNNPDNPFSPYKILGS